MFIIVNIINIMALHLLYRLFCKIEMHYFDYQLFLFFEINKKLSYKQLLSLHDRLKVL